MELPCGDVFDAEGDTVPEDVVAEQLRRSYRPRVCEEVASSSHLVSSDPSDIYSLKMAGDHAYLTRDYSAALGFYEQYLRQTLSPRRWRGL